jgi:hypothetical protein
MLCWILIVGGLLIMMGQHDRSEALFYFFRLEDQVPETHLLRLIEKHISFAFVRERLKAALALIDFEKGRLGDDLAATQSRLRRFSRTTPIPNAAGIPTSNPPTIQTYRMGDCEAFAPGKNSTAATSAKAMKKTPTLVGTAFPVTLIQPLW